MLSLALLGVAALPTVTASGAFFTDQASQTGNTAAAATLGEVSTLTATPSAAVAGPPAVQAGYKTDLSWASATGQAWATSNSVTSGVTYTVKRSETADFTGAATVYEGAGTTYTDPGNLPAIRSNTISAGSGISCGLSTAGTAYCWGQNNFGGLGIGTVSSTPTLTPVKVDTSGVLKDKTLVSISAGSSGACALDSAGAAYCWGTNSGGQVGNGTSGTNVPSPVAVSTTGVLAGKKLIAISVGNGANCALDANGAAYCWGFASSGRLGVTVPVVPPATVAFSAVPVAVQVDKALKGKTLTDITAGASSACVLDSEGQAYCWGGGQFGNLGNDTTTAVSADPVAVTMPAGVKFRQIDGRASTYCALSTTDAAYCWGYNNDLQTGSSGTTVNKPSPVTTASTGITTYKKIKSGFTVSCAIGTDDKTYCWGGNVDGELGNGTTGTAKSATPTPIVPASGDALFGKTLADISIGGGATVCGAEVTGVAYCWGRNIEGIGNSAAATKNPKPLLVQFSTEPLAWKSMDMGSDLGGACGITTGNRVYCWGGTNTDGQTGNGTKTATTRPVPVDTTGVLAGKTMTAVTLSNIFACALDSDGIAYCWGNNTRGALGDGTTVSSTVPVRVKTTGALAGAKFTAIASNDSTACGLTTAGKVFCWGSNSYGVIAATPAVTGFASEPVLVNKGTFASRTITKLSMGASTTCAIDSTSMAYCWGYNRDGNVGNGTTTNPIDTPTAIRNFTDISVGSFTTCALDASRLAYCWGSSTAGGSLGTGSTANEYVSTPTRVSGSTTYSSIYTGTYGACALTVSGSVPYCWGNNNSGQVGNNSTTDAPTPRAVTTTGSYTVGGSTVAAGLAGKTVASLSVWNAYSGSNPNGRCAIATDGSMSCWGANNNSTFGTPTTTIASSNFPRTTGETSTTIAVTRTYARCPSGETPSTTGTCGLDPTIAYNYQVGYKYYLWESPLKTAVRTATP